MKNLILILSLSILFGSTGYSNALQDCKVEDALQPGSEFLQQLFSDQLTDNLISKMENELNYERNRSNNPWKIKLREWNLQALKDRQFTKEDQSCDLKDSSGSYFGLVHRLVEIRRKSGGLIQATSSADPSLSI